MINYSVFYSLHYYMHGVNSIPEKKSHVHNEALNRKSSWTSSVYDESGLERQATLRKVKKLPGQRASQSYIIRARMNI